MAQEVKEKIDITHLNQEMLVRLMANSGFREASLDLLEQDIAAGAPVNEDGTITLFDFAAWLYTAGYNKGGING